MRKLLIGGAFLALLMVPAVSASAAPAAGAAINDAVQSNPILQDVDWRRRDDGDWRRRDREGRGGRHGRGERHGRGGRDGHGGRDGRGGREGRKQIDWAKFSCEKTCKADNCRVNARGYENYCAEKRRRCLNKCGGRANPP
jgi:hypothetical protein